MMKLLYAMIRLLCIIIVCVLVYVICFVALLLLVVLPAGAPDLSVASHVHAIATPVVVPSTSITGVVYLYSVPAHSHPISAVMWLLPLIPVALIVAWFVRRRRPPRTTL